MLLFCPSLNELLRVCLLYHLNAGGIAQVLVCIAVIVLVSDQSIFE